MDGSVLLWGVLFGAIGLGFFVYGRKQRVITPFACGLALMLLPYFISDTLPLVIVGVVLVALPFIIRY